MGMTRIARSYNFESAHFLPKVPEEHRCRRMHGHNYKVEVTFLAELDARGFVKDFAEIDFLIAPLIAEVDHRVLNDIAGLDNPTAEFIAAWFLARLPEAASVRIYENDRSWAEVVRA